MNSFYYTSWSSPVGEFHLLADDSALHMLAFDKKGSVFKKMYSNALKEQNSILKKTIQQLEEYFKGTRKDFDLPLKFSGTDFQQKAWKALLEIPYGKTVSYKTQAAKIKNPKAVRAIGSANGRNPLAVIIPCHRVIAHDGSLGGYGGGLSMKKALLQMEASIPKRGWR